MLKKKIVIGIFAAMCLSIDAAPKKKKSKKPDPVATSCAGDGSGTEESSRRSLQADLPPEIKAQILKIRSSEKSPFFFLSEEDVEKYKPLAEEQVRTFFPLGRDRLFQRGGISPENKAILKRNQLTNLNSINKTLGNMTERIKGIVDLLKEFNQDDIDDCLKVIKTRFNKLKPKLVFSIETFKSQQGLELLFMEVIDFISALSWINEYKQNFSTKDEVLDKAIKSVVSGIYGFFKIIDRGAALGLIEATRAELAFGILGGGAVFSTSKEDKSEPSQSKGPSGGAGSSEKKESEEQLDLERLPENLKALTEDINAFNTGHLKTPEHYARATNQLILDSLDYYEYHKEIAATLDIPCISKKTNSDLFLEIKLKIARILTNFAKTIVLKLQDEALKGCPHAREVFTYYVDFSLNFFSQQKNPAFQYQLGLLKKEFEKLEPKDFEFLFDSLSRASTNTNYLFSLISRVVLPSPWMQDESTARDIFLMRRLLSHQREMQESHLGTFLDLTTDVRPLSMPALRKLKKGMLKPDIMSVPTRRAEMELSSCESLSSFKITIPELKLKDISILPSWMKHTAEYLAHESSFLNGIPSSDEMFTYKYSAASQEELLLQFAALCSSYKSFVNEQDTLLEVEPGRLSTTRLLAIFSSIKHLVFSRPEIDLESKMQIWRSSFGIPLDFLDISQIGEWLKSIEKIDYLEKLFESSEDLEEIHVDDDLPALELVEPDSDYDPLAADFLASLK